MRTHSFRRHILPVLAAGFVACVAAVQRPSDPAQREGFVVTADGVRLAFRVEGDAADTVVVLHGGPGFTSEAVRPDLAPLAERFTLIFYDQRGSGRSTALKDSNRISLAHHVADLEAVRNHFHLERMVLAGHSWGAGLALHYAVTHRARTARLLLIDPMPLRRDPHIADFGRNLSAWMDSATRTQLTAAAQARATAADPFAACRAYWAIFIHGYLAEPRGPVTIRAEPCSGTAETLVNPVYRYTLGVLGAWDWRAEARTVRGPVLVVHGAQSPIPAESFREWATAIAQARIVEIAGSGHFPHAEQPAAFLAASEAFLRGR